MINSSKTTECKFGVLKICINILTVFKTKFSEDIVPLIVPLCRSVLWTGQGDWLKDGRTSPVAWMQRLSPQWILIHPGLRCTAPAPPPVPCHFPRPSPDQLPIRLLQLPPNSFLVSVLYIIFFIYLGCAGSSSLCRLFFFFFANGKMVHS